MGKERNWSRSMTRGETENSGCMGSMLHYLDFHRLLFISSHGGTSTGNCGSGIRVITGSLPLSSPSLPVSHVSNSQFKGCNIGLEAPRNSLEMDDGKTAMSTLAMKEESYVDVPVGIRIVPVASSSASSKNSMAMVLEDVNMRSSTQGDTSRTPSVVARLMGLEVLPDQTSSPGACSPSTPPLLGKSIRQPLRSLNCSHPALPEIRSFIDVNNSLSLPETPRASVSSTRSWDPRFSLQLNKENNCNAAHTEFSYLCQVPSDYSLSASPFACAAAKSRKKHGYTSHPDENKSPSNHFYAREVVKQLKEAVNRVGGNEEIRAKFNMTSSQAKKKEDYVETQNQSMSLVMKPKVPPPPLKRPPDMLPEVKKANGSEGRDLKPPLPKESCGGRDEGRIGPMTTVLPNRCKKTAFEQFSEKNKKQSPAKGNNNKRPSLSQTLPAVALAEKQIALDCQKKHSLNASNTVTSRRKEASASPSRSYCSPSQEHVIKLGSITLRSSGDQKTPPPAEQDPEYRYLKSVLERAARDMGSIAAPCLRWHSPALPVDPALFHQLELELQEDDVDDECRRLRLGPLRHRWNRKLLFHVIEEILADLLLEWSDRPSSATVVDHMLSRESRTLYFLSCGGKTCSKRPGEQLLLRQLWARIRSFPEADCRVVGNIDDLVAGDLSGANTRRLLRHPSVVEEAEDVVVDVEQELLESLIEEAAAWLVLAPAASLEVEAAVLTGAPHHGGTHNFIAMVGGKKDGHDYHCEVASAFTTIY